MSYASVVAFIILHARASSNGCSCPRLRVFVQYTVGWPLSDLGGQLQRLTQYVVTCRRTC